MTSDLRGRGGRRSPLPGRTLLVGALLLLSGPVVLPGPARAQEERAARGGRGEEGCERQLVSEREIEEVIRDRRGYDITAAPNQGRFLAELLLGLADRYRRRQPSGPPLLVRQEEFFPTFLRVMGLSTEDAPPGFHEAYRYRQRMVVEYRVDSVVERVLEGPEPRQALAVRAAWPDKGDLPSSYTYEDTASDPDVRVHQERNVTYRLLEYTAVVVYDQMKGVSGRPTSGALGALFDVLGTVEIRESRFAPAGQGAQVTYSRVRKLATMETLATITADGRARRGIPEGRPRLQRLRSILERDRAVEHAETPPQACFTEPARVGAAPDAAPDHPRRRGATAPGHGMRPTASSVVLPR